MSGRAGRRGLDEKGIVLLMIDEKVGPDVAKCIVQGQADPLNSAFHLTYNMILNLMRVEDINPEYMLERSFAQFQNQAAIPNVCASEYLFIGLNFCVVLLMKTRRIWSMIPEMLRFTTDAQFLQFKFPLPECILLLKFY